MKRGNATLLDDPAYKSKLAELEIDLLATEFTELRSLASAANGAEPGPESSILKLKGTEIQQRIQKLTVRLVAFIPPRGARSQWATVSPRAVCPAICQPRLYDLWRCFRGAKDVVQRTCWG